MSELNKMACLSLRPFEDGEPRVRDIDLGDRLGFDRPRKIRDLIERNFDEVERYGRCPAVGQRPETGGPEATEYWLNEDQALLVCMLSKTPRAADVRQEVIEVFRAYRHGTLVPAMPTLAQIGSLFDQKLEPVTDRIDRIEGNVTFLAGRIDDMAPRHDFPKEVKRQWRAVVHLWHRDLCPCCGRVKILDEAAEAIPGGLHYDHFRGRERNGIDEGWPVCPECNFRLKNDSEFKEKHRAHFAVFHDHRQEMFAGHRPGTKPRRRRGGGTIPNSRQGRLKL